MKASQLRFRVVNCARHGRLRRLSRRRRSPRLPGQHAKPFTRVQTAEGLREAGGKESGLQSGREESWIRS